MSHNPEAGNEIRKAKECLYNLYYEILEEIKGRAISIDNEGYDELVASIKIPKLIRYIKEAIQILLEKKIEEYKSAVKPKSSIGNELKDYEVLLRKYEEGIKQKHRKLFRYRYKIESLEVKIKAYMEMEDEFEDMKEKLKYEDGKFLDNDRKENEILILRSENSNLKKAIRQYDLERNEKINNSKKDKETIVFLQTQIVEFNRKIKQMELIQNDINLSMNNSKINLSGNTANINASSLQKEKVNSDPERNELFSLSERTQLESKIKFFNAKRNKAHEKKAGVDKNEIYNIYKRIFNDLEEKNASPKKGHQKNYSVIDMKNNKKNSNIKYFSNHLDNNAIQFNKNDIINNNININYVKINNLLPSSKSSISSRPHNQTIRNPINKLYKTNAKVLNNSTNKSLLSMRGFKSEK